MEVDSLVSEAGFEPRSALDQIFAEKRGLCRRTWKSSFRNLDFVERTRKKYNDRLERALEAKQSHIDIVVEDLKKERKAINKRLAKMEPKKKRSKTR